MKFKWRKWNRAIHRDFGYLFFGMTIIYCLSGIAINHIKDWNPNYIINTYEFTVATNQEFNKAGIKKILKDFDIDQPYRNHYRPEENEVKVFLKDGNLIINTDNGYCFLEITKKRPIFKPMNYLHYNPVKVWTWISDIFSGALILLAITGLFIVKGSKGITKRGLWMTLTGIAVTVIILFIYYY